MSMKNTIIVNKKKIGIVSGIIGPLLVIIALTNSFYVRDYRGILEQYPEFDLFLIENFTNRVELLGRAGQGWALWRYFDDGTAKMYVNSTRNLHDTFYWQVFEGSTQVKYRELHPVNVSYSDKKAEIRVVISYFYDSYHTNPVGNLTRVIEAYPYFNKETVIWEPVNQTVNYNLKWNHETKNTIREKLEGTEVTIGAIRISWADSKEKVSSAWRYANGKMYVRYTSKAGIQIIDPTVTVVGVGTDSPTINQGDTINLTANVTTCANCTLSTVLFEITYPDGTKTNFTSYTISQNSLISFWDFNNNSANDSYGSNDGTVSGATYNATGGHNGRGAYMFDGIDDNISIADNSGLDPSTITVCAWMKQKEIGYDRGILSKRLAGKTESHSLLIAASNKVEFRVVADSTVNAFSVSTITDTNEHLICGRYNGSNQDVFIDGVDDSAGTYANTGSIVDSNSPLMIGKYYDDNRIFNGTLDNIRLYGSALSDSEILALYDQEKNNRFNYSFSDTSQIGTYTIKVFANDTLGGMNSTETTTFSVNDTELPDVENLTTNVSSLNQGQSILIYSNIVDDPMSFIDTVLYEITYPNSVKQNNTIYTYSQNSLISSWFFDNASAGDNFGSNDGTVSGATYNTAGGHNSKGAYEFDGVDDFITVPNSASLDANETISISFWMYALANGGDYQDILYKDAGDIYEYWSIAYGKTAYQKIYAWVVTDPLGSGNNASDTIWSDTIVAETWYFFVLTYDANNATDTLVLYQDGVKTDSDAHTGTIKTGADLIIGGGRLEGFNGTIDDIRFYNSTFNASQVAILYDQEKNNRFNLSFSDTSLIGTYTVTVFANDTPGGNMNGTEQITFSVNDSEPPIVENLSTNGTPIDQWSTIELSANIVDDAMSFIDTVLFEITYPDGTKENNTVFQLSEHSLVSFWSFDNESASDNFGSNDGTVSGATYNSTGGHDGKGAYMFDGTNDEISMGNDSSLNPTNMTISVWVSKTTTGGDQVAVGKRSGGDPGYVLHYFGNKFNFEVDTDTPLYVAVGDTSDITPNTWIHYVGTYNGTKAILYKNGIAVANSDISGSMSNSATFYVGRRAANSYWNGSIDDIHLYNYSMTASEVAALYDQEKNNRFNLSFSDTSKNGTYTFLVFANDTPRGNMNNTESSTFVVSDTDYASISNLAVNSSEILRNQSVKVNCTIIVDSPANVSWAYMEVTYPNNSAKNWSMTNGSNTDEYYGIFRDAKQLGNYTVKIWANSTSELGILWNESADNVTFETHRRNVSASVPSCLGSLVFNATNSNATTKDIVPYNQTNSCGAFNITNTESWNLSSIWMRIDPDINGYEFEVSTSGTFYQPTNLTYVWQALNNSSLNSGSSRMIWIRLDLDWPVLPWNGSFYFGPEDE